MNDADVSRLVSTIKIATLLICLAILANQSIVGIWGRTISEDLQAIQKQLEEGDNGE